LFFLPLDPFAQAGEPADALVVDKYLRHLAQASVEKSLARNLAKLIKVDLVERQALGFQQLLGADAVWAVGFGADVAAGETCARCGARRWPRRSSI
jgi:hypothetical protein